VARRWRVSAVSDADVEQFRRFSSSGLTAPSTTRRAVRIGLASETCHSGARIVAQTRGRLDRLTGVRDSVPGFAAYFDHQLSPACRRFERKARAIYAELGQDFDAELPQHAPDADRIRFSALTMRCAAPTAGWLSSISNISAGTIR